MKSLEENVSLAKYSTLGIGGPARFFLLAKNKAEIISALSFAKNKNLPAFVLGEGSNTVFSDKGFKGIVIKLGMKKIVFTDSGKARVEAGASWDEFVAEAVNRKLGGVENLSAIPGTVGSAPIQNIGAYGTEASDTIKEVRAIDREKLEEVTLSKEECGFGYRKSIFNSSRKNQYIITEAVFELAPNGKPNIAYQDLINYFGDKKPTLKETRAAVLEIRTKKGHVKPPNGPRSAGSFFKNPLVEKEVFEKIKDKIENRTGSWFWAQRDGKIKISAARLIEGAGFAKGMRFGNVGISPFHSLVLVTYDAATARELLDFADQIRAKTKHRFNIQLDIEPELAGFKLPKFR